MLTRRAFSILAGSAPLALGASWAELARAQAGGADLNVSPRRLVIPESGRTESVLVFNRGNAAATYNIECIDRVMTSDGSIRALNDPAAPAEAASIGARLKSAKEFVVFTPRRVTLQPGESQTIRIRISRPDKLPAGEYRTHLTVTAVPPQNFGLTADQAAAPGSQDLSVQLIPLFSISIPVIIRQGPVDAKAELREVKIGPGDGGKPTLSLKLARRGGSSVFGDIDAKTPRGVLVASLHGVAVYPEIEARTLNVPLLAAVAPGEEITVTFTDQEASPGAVLARQTLRV